MKQKEIEYSKLLLNMSNSILEYFKKYGINDSAKYFNKELNNEKNNIILEEQEQYANADSDKVNIISSQKENKNILPLLIGGWILYKILK